MRYAQASTDLIEFQHRYLPGYYQRLTHFFSILLGWLIGTIADCFECQHTLFNFNNINDLDQKRYLKLGCVHECNAMGNIFSMIWQQKKAAYKYKVFHFAISKRILVSNSTRSHTAHRSIFHDKKSKKLSSFLCFTERKNGQSKKSEELLVHSVN